MKNLIKYTLLFFSLMPFWANATTKTATGTNWATSAHWSPSGMPADGDDIIIPTGITMSLNTSYTYSLSTFTIQGTGILELNTKTLTMGSLTGDGTVKNTGSTTKKNLTVGSNNTSTTFTGVISDYINLIKSGTGTLTLSGVNTYSGTTTISAGTLKLGAAGVIPDASDVTVTGTLDMNTFSETLGSIAGAGTIDNVSGGGTPMLSFGSSVTSPSSTTFSGIIQNTTGTLSITKLGTGTIYLSGNNTFTGSVNGSSGQTDAGKISISHSNALGVGPKDVNLQGINACIQQIELSGGISVPSNITIKTASRTVTSDKAVFLNNLSGDNTWAGNIEINSGGGSSGIRSIAGTLTVSGTIQNSYTSSRTMQFRCNSGNITVLGNIIDGTSTLNVQKIDGTGTLLLSGTNTYSGTTIINSSAGTLMLGSTTALGSSAGATADSSGSVIDLNGYTLSASEALSINGSGISSGGALINSGSAASFSGAVTLIGDATINTSNNITLSGTISPSTYSLTKSGANSLIFSSNIISVNNLTISAGTLSAGSSTINIYGNFTNSGTFTCGTGTVNFVGSSAQAIAAATFNNLTLNNSTSPASSAATLTGNVTVGGTFTLTTGILNTSSYYVDLGSVGSISESNPSSTAPTSYVIGTVNATRNIGSTSGNVTFGGIGLEITESATTNNSTSVSRVTGTASTGAGKSSIKRYFDISPATDVSLNGTMVFYYIDDELNGQDETDFILYKSDSRYSTWTKQISSAVNTATNSISLASITSFSRWTGSNKTTSSLALPVDFIYFNVKNENGINKLAWKTGNEINNEYFEIERSHDGIEFEAIGKVNGSGTKNSETEYMYVDKFSNVKLTNYYRLKQVDFDKKFEYSSIVFIAGEIKHKEFNLYPNPLEKVSTLNIKLGKDDEGIANVLMFDMNGTLIKSYLIDDVSAGSTITIENENLPYTKGLYILEIKTLQNNYKQKLEVK